jgi:serine/threonine protein kinase
VHRDLKPDNIVLSLDKPIKVALIDFDRSLPVTNTCHTGTRGTPGYQPDLRKWFDGDKVWDMYSLACTVVECDMAANEYIKVNDERSIKAAVKKHVESKGTCEHIFNLAERVILRYNDFDDTSLDEAAEMIKRMRFRQLK